MKFGFAKKKKKIEVPAARSISRENVTDILCIGTQ
jgi:hypothetical protein